jgi:hypothetical protein
VLAGVVVCAICGWFDDSPVVPRDGGLLEGSHTIAVVFLVALAVAFAGYLVGLWALRGGGRLRLVIALAVAIQVVPLATPLLLSSDAYSYWAYAKVDNPYSDTPSDAGVAAQYAGRDWLDKTSLYGPAFSLATEPLGAVDSHDFVAWTFKTIAAASVLALVVLAARRSRRPAFAAAFVGWNPVLAIHSAGGGHNDAIVGGLAATAVALAAHRRASWSGAAWALASLVKWVPVLFFALAVLAARARRRPTGVAGFAVTALVASVLATRRYGLDWVGALGPLADDAVRRTTYALPSRLDQLGVPYGAALALSVAALAVGLAWLARDASRGTLRLGRSACLVLATTPYLAVWYLAWAVPLAAPEDDDRVARLAALALTAYLLPQTIPL